MRKPKLTAEEIEAYKAEHGIAAGSKLAWLHCQSQWPSRCSRCGLDIATGDTIIYRPADWPEGGKRGVLCRSCADTDPTVVYDLRDVLGYDYFYLPRR